MSEDEELLALADAALERQKAMRRWTGAQWSEWEQRMAKAWAEAGEAEYGPDYKNRRTSTTKNQE